MPPHPGDKMEYLDHAVDQNHLQILLIQLG